VEVAHATPEASNRGLVLFVVVLAAMGTPDGDVRARLADVLGASSALARA
jgi:hypothetical protein